MKNLIDRFLDWVFEKKVRCLWFIIFLLYGITTLTFVFFKLIGSLTVPWWDVFIPVYIVVGIYAIYKFTEVINKDKKSKS